MNADVSPVKTEPSLVRATVVAFVDGPGTPGVFPTVGFHAAIVPSSVEKIKAAGLLGATGKSVVLLFGIIPVGVPVGKVLSLGSDFGIVTTRLCLAPAPL